MTNNDRGYALAKNRALRDWYANLPPWEKQQIDKWCDEIESGIKKRGEAMGTKAWFGRTMALELIAEILLLYNL